MNHKTIHLVLQLLFVIVVVAVIATHVRIAKKEFFRDIQGTVGEDQNLMVTGKIMASSGAHQLGDSRIPDEKGNIHLTPTGNEQTIYLNGQTILNNKLCFRQRNNNQQCFDANSLGTDTLALNDKKLYIRQKGDEYHGLQYNPSRDGPDLFGHDYGGLGTYKNGVYNPVVEWNTQRVGIHNNKELEFGVGENKHPDAGKIKYGGFDGSALNIVGAGGDGFNRKVRVWDNLCIGNQCIRENDIQTIKQLPTDIQAIKNDTANMINSRNPTDTLQWSEGRVKIPNDREVEFGAGQNKEVNAGKIKYGGWWDNSALNIVGAGADAGNRKVRVWDRLQVGPLEIQNNGCIRYGPNNRYQFCLQSDGNLVQYKDGRPVWATNKYG